MSETQLIVALWVTGSLSLYKRDMSGVVLVDPARSLTTLIESRGDGSLAGFTFVRRGTSSSPSSLPLKIRDSRFRGLPRVREWPDRAREPLPRDPKQLMKTRVGRVGGSIKVIFFATWTSAFSTEKMDEGDAERERCLLVAGVSGET